MPGNLTRWPALVVAMTTSSPGPPTVAATAARIASPSRASGDAVGLPDWRSEAQNSAAFRQAARETMIGIVDEARSSRRASFARALILNSSLSTSKKVRSERKNLVPARSWLFDHWRQARTFVSDGEEQRSPTTPASRTIRRANQEIPRKSGRSGRSASIASKKSRSSSPGSSGTSSRRAIPSRNAWAYSASSASVKGSTRPWASSRAVGAEVNFEVVATVANLRGSGGLAPSRLSPGDGTSLKLQTIGPERNDLAATGPGWIQGR